MGFDTLTQWTAWLRARGKAERTIRLYAYGVFRLYSEHVSGPVTEEHVVSFLNSIGGQNGTKRKYLLGLRSFFSYCQRKGLLTTDPTVGLSISKPPKTRQRALSEEELYRLLMAAWERDPRRYWSLLLVLGIGARRMEAVGIEPRDVASDSVHLRHCKRGKERWVPLGPLAASALKGLEPHMNGTVLGGIRAGTLSDWAVEAARDAGLREKVRGRSLHVLRASYASHLLRRGVAVHVVRELLGHDSIDTTDAYSLALDEDLKEGASRW